MKLNWHTLSLLLLFLPGLIGITTAANYYKSMTNQCGRWFRTTSTCTNYGASYCSSSTYYTGSTSCGTGNPSSCTGTPDTTHSCGSNTVCGMCSGSADTCGTATCGLTYGCAGGSICDGVGTGAGHCLATFGTGAACNCSAQCTSGVCTGNLCQAKYQSSTNLCGYYTGTSSSCGSATNYCNAGTYYPSQACSATPTYTSCQSETAANSCAVCGDCAGGGVDTCNVVACGTTNSYGCGSGSYCNGAKGTGSCNAPFGTGVACNCSAQCTSGVCTGNLCQAKYQSSTNLCGYYTGTSSSCSSANTFCAAGTYYPSQTCSATPTYTSCQTGYCAVCGDCAGSSDTCSAKTCGTTGYDCAGGSICDGQGTGASHCNAIGGLGTTCYCAAQCQSGLYCVGNVCTLLTYSSNSTNSTFAGTPIQHNLYWQETGGGASGYIFRFCNGTWDGSNCLTATTGWLYGWQYRKQHNITGSTAGAQTNYPIHFKVYNTTGTDSGENVYLGINVLSDFGDVRFTDSNGNLLNYWMEELGSNYATFWVSITSIPASPDSATIYLYYGNAAATTTQDNLNLDIWQMREHYFAASYPPDVAFTKSAASVLQLNSSQEGQSGAYAFLIVNRSYLQGKKLKAYWRVYETSGLDPNIFLVYIIDHWHLRSRTDSSSEWKEGTNTDYPIVNYNYVNPISLYESDNTWQTDTSSTLDLSSFTSTYVTLAVFLADHWSGEKESGEIDYLQILDASNNVLYTFDFNQSVNMEVTGTYHDYGLYRNYVNPEPAHGNWGSEASTNWITDSWVQFTSGMCSSPYTACWSNVTKTVNSSVGATIAWCVLANDTSNNWNTTSCTTPFTYTTTAPPAAASISTDNTSYTACGTVFYKVKLYDQNSRLVNSYFTLNVINPSLSTVSTVGSAYPNNGTGIFTGNYTLNATSPLGTWLLKVLESGGATSGKNFFVATTCGDKICADGENIDNCPGDCPIS